MAMVSQFQWKLEDWKTWSSSRFVSFHRYNSVILLVGSSHSFWYSSLIASTENLKGTLPSEVGKLTKLTILSLRTLFLFVCVVACSGSHPFITHKCIFPFQLRPTGDNHLDGTLPSEVGNLSILRTLQLGMWWFYGSIHWRFWLTYYKHVHFFIPACDKSDNNSFTGTIPDDIGRLGTLQNLVLSEYSLLYRERCGEMSDHTFFLTFWLQLFGTGNNEFHSHIPAEVNQLTTLEELRLGKS